MKSAAALHVVLLSVCLGQSFGLGAGCGQPDPEGMNGPQATIALISPMAPLGLSYGEQATLLLRYRQKGQQEAGVVLNLHIDGENTGATLSADRIVTNDHGEASVLFTAGAAEAAFHILASAPLAQDLVIDVAVSKYDFGNLDVLLDATEVPGSVTLLRAALITGTTCAALPPMPMQGPVLRLQQAGERVATLPFPTLLVSPYSVIGRAEDPSKRLLAYGCVDVPDSLLRTGLRPVVPVPLGLVFPSPLGSYDLTLKLTTQPAAPTLWDQLACSVGLGQVLLNAILETIAVSDTALLMRITALRERGLTAISSSDGRTCLPTSPSLGLGMSAARTGSRAGSCGGRDSSRMKRLTIRSSRE